MQLNTNKCEVTGWCFATNKACRTDTIRYNGQHMKSLDGKHAFKYLGLRVACNGATAKEREYVRERAVEISRLARTHPYHADQMEDILRSAVRPAFTYSAPLTAWSYRQMRELEIVWGRIHKSSWRLTTGHQTAPFVVGAAEGGMSDRSIYTLRAKECAGLLSALVAHGDGDMLQLVQQELEWLKADWGTEDPWQLQICLMLGDAPESTPTLLSQAMIAFGHVGQTWQWSKLDMPFTGGFFSDSILTYLERPLWTKILHYWETGKGLEEQLLLAEALR